MFSFTADTHEIEEVAKHFAHGAQVLAQELLQAMHEAVALTEANIIQQTPVDTGRLRASIQSHIEVEGNTILGVIDSANVPYALFVEEDTKAHDIVPKTAQALAFHPKAGQEIGTRRNLYAVQRGSTAGRLVKSKSARTAVIVKKVRHPGTHGRHMFRDGGKQSEPEIQRAFDQAVIRTVERLK